MVAAFVRSHGAEFVKSAGTTDTYALTATVPAGNLLVMALVHDNAATTLKPFVSSITKMSGETASWVHLGRSLSASTSAGAFADGELWMIKTTVDWTNGTSLTVTYDTSITMKSQNILEFSGVEATLRSTVGVATYSTTTTAATATTTGTAPVIGDLAIGLIFGSNVAAAQAGDTDTTGGSWSAVTGVGSTGGSGATNNYGITQHKIVTSTSHQTYNNSAAMTAGNGAIVAVLQATIDPLVTQAAYRVYGDGTETGSTALAAQDTAPTVVVSSDANVQVRVRLQETAGGISTAATDWQLQWEKNTSGTWADVASTGLVATYAVANQNDNQPLSGTNTGIGQSFLGDGKKLARARFYLRKVGAPPSSALTVALYAHTGTYGSTGKVTGAALATSTTSLNATAVATTSTAYDFDFDGTYTLAAGTPYVIAITTATSGDSTNHTGVGIDISPAHAGNQSDLISGVWDYTTSSDVVFEVHGPTPTTVVPYDSASLTPTPTVASESLTDVVGERINQLAGRVGVGQSFLGDGRKLAQATFKLKRQPLAANVGPVWVEVYAHSGTFGTSSVATGSPLATSTSIDGQADVGTTAAWKTFDFDSTLTLTNGTPYVVVARCGALGSTGDGGVDVSLSTTNVHAGNHVRFSSSSVWSAVSFDDCAFQVFTVPVDQPTTNRLGAGSGSFVAGEVSEDGLVDDLGWTASNYTELLYSVTLKSADLANADSLRFRVLRNGATTGLTYTAYPTITVSKVTTPQGTGAGSWSFTGAGVGYRLPKASPTGAWSFTGAAVGKRTPKAVPVGAWSFTGTAVGTAPAAAPEEGAAAGTWAWVGAAVGKRTPVAAPTGSWSFAGAVVGKRTPVATVTGAWSFAGAAVGKRVARAAPVGAWSYAGAAVGSAPAVGMKYGTATGAWSFAGTAVGNRSPKATTSGTLAWTGTAVGAAPVVGMKYGTGTGAWSFAGAAVGKRTPKAAPTGTFTFTGAAVGDAPPNRGTSTSTWSWTGTVVGKRVAKATTTGTWSLAGAAVGKRVAKATPTGTWAFTGAAVGYRTPKATPTGAWSYAGTSVGKRAPKAAPVGTWTFAGAAVGKRTPKATPTGTFAWTGNAAGTAPVVGQNDGFAVGAVHWGGVATARTQHRGTAVGTLAWTGVATAVTTHRGTGTGAWSFLGAAAGKRPARATPTGTWTWIGTAAGKRTPKATPAGTWTFTGTGVGRRIPKATSTGSWLYTGTAAGTILLRGTATGAWLYVGTALARTQHRATGAGTLTYTGVAVGLAPALDFADGTATGTRLYIGFAYGVARLFPTTAARTSVAAADPRVSIAGRDPRVSIAAADPRVSVAPPDPRVSVGAATDRTSTSNQ